MTFANALIFFSILALLIKAADAADKITFVTSAATYSNHGVRTLFSLNAELSTSPLQTINVEYRGPTCRGPVLSEGLVSATDLTASDNAEVSGTTVTITNDVVDIHAAVGIQDDDTMAYCIRMSLFRDDILIDIEEVIITVTVNLDVELTIGSVKEAKSLSSSETEASATASAYLCDPSKNSDSQLPDAVTSSVMEGDSFSLCFHSDAGVVGLAALTLRVEHSDGVSKWQNFFTTTAPSFGDNSCETALEGGSQQNGDGSLLTTAVGFCSVTINEIPSRFFLDGNNDAADVTVTGTATVIVQLSENDGNGRQLVQRHVRLLGGIGSAEASVAPFSANPRADESCECPGGFFFLLCWFFKCFLGFF